MVNLDPQSSYDAVEVVYRSEVCGLRLGFADLGTPGLLIGLVQEGKNIAGIELRKLGLDESVLIEQVKLLQTNDPRKPVYVFESCFSEKQFALRTYSARSNLGHRGTYAEHILISILGMQGGGHLPTPTAAQQMLASLGVDCQKLRMDIIDAIADEPRFKGVPKESLDNGTTYRASYLGVLVRLSFRIKHEAYDRLQQLSDPKEEDEALLIYADLMRELQTLEERAAERARRVGVR